jgi:DNA-binding CsgD family transcriptional regulator
MLDVVDRAHDGIGGLRIVTGEAGIGKTHLLRATLDAARDRGCTVLAGRAQEYDAGLVYASLRDILASTNRDALDTPTHTNLDDLLRATDAAPEADSRASPLLLAAAFFRSLSAGQPLVVGLDDAHLADEESMTALSFATRNAATAPIVLALTVRRDRWSPGSTFATTIGRRAESDDVVDLAPLDGDQTAALVAAALDQPPGDGLVEHVYAWSRGNPLFVHELVTSLRNDGAIRSDGGRAYFVGNPTPGVVSRRGALLQRIFEQNSDARELARTMSALRRIRADDVDVLAECSGIDPERVPDAFDSLTRASVLVRSDAGWYEFTHPLLAEVLYDDLGPLERRRIHQRFADYLGPRRRSDGAGVLEWATHVTEAADLGDADAAAAALEAAASTRVNAPLTAAEWYRRAIDLLTPDDPQRPGLLARRSSALWAGSRPDTAIEVGEEALATLTDPARRRRVLAGVLGAQYAMGHYDQTRDLLDRERDTLAGAPPVVALESLVLAHLGRGHDALARFHEARAGMSAADAETKLTTIVYLALAGHLIGAPETAGAVDDLLAFAVLPDDELSPGARIVASDTAAYVLIDQTQVTRATAALQQSAPLADRVGTRNLGGQRVSAQARIEYQRGNWDQSLETIRSGAVLLEFEGLRNNLSWLRLLEAQIVAQQGEFAQALALVDDPATALPCSLYEALVDVVRCLVWELRGEVDVAAACLDARCDRLRREGLVCVLGPALLMETDVHNARGDHARARAAAAELNDLAGAAGTPFLHRAAELARATAGADVDAAGAAFDDAQRDGDRVTEGRARYTLATLGVDADAHLRAAAELFGAMGARAWTRRVASEAKRRGVTLPHSHGARSRPGNPLVLTPTEHELVQLLQQGFTNREIARDIHLSPKTVEVYLTRLYQKLGCRSRADVVRAADRGELPLEM